MKSILNINLIDINEIYANDNNLKNCFLFNTHELNRKNFHGVRRMNSNFIHMGWRKWVERDFYRKEEKKLYVLIG